MEKTASYLTDKKVLMISCALLCRKEGMAEYFKKRAKEFCLITITTKYSKGLKPTLCLYERGLLREERVLKILKKPDFLFRRLAYLYHLSYLISIFVSVLILRKRFDLCVSEGQLTTLLGLILKKIALVGRVVYSSGDYFVKIRVYRALDAFLTSRVDVIWNASEAMSRRRCQVLGREIRQFVMPLGLSLHEKEASENRPSGHEIIYIGNVQERHGLDLLMAVLPGLVSEVRDFKLHVVGAGPDREKFEKEVKGAGLSAFVEFHGFVSDEAELEKIFARCILGLALYAPEAETLTRYSDPGKIKDYLSYGLPVVTTDVPSVAQKIKERDAGWVVPYRRESLAELLRRIFENEGELSERAAGARWLAKDYLWDNIMDRVLSETVDYWREKL